MLSPETETLLIRLNKKASPVDTDGERLLAETLVEEGLAERVSPAKAAAGAPSRYRLTDAGAERKEARKKEQKEADRASRPGRQRAVKATPLTRADLEAELATFEARLAVRANAMVDRLIAALRPREAQRDAAATDGHRPAEPSATPAAGDAVRDPALGEQILAHLRRLDMIHRFDGLVPLPHLRRALPTVPRATLDACLFELERSQRVSLKISNDPRAAAEPDAGIRLEGRGLIYYAVPE